MPWGHNTQGNLSLALTSVGLTRCKSLQKEPAPLIRCLYKDTFTTQVTITGALVTSGFGLKQYEGKLPYDTLVFVRFGLTVGVNAL